MTATPRQLRWARALLLSVVVLTTGSLAHLSAHGLMPGPWAMATLLALGTAGAAPLLDGPASTRRVVLLVVGGQTLVHMALTALAGHAGDVRRPAAPVPLMPPSRTGSLYDQLMPTPTPTQLRTPDWVFHLANDLTGPHAAMAVAHLVAAGLVGLWLASGERGLWSLLLLVVNPVLAEPWSWPVRPRVPQVAHQVDVLRRSSWRRALPRRGPPFSFAL